MLPEPPSVTGPVPRERLLVARYVKSPIQEMGLLVETTKPVVTFSDPPAIVNVPEAAPRAAALAIMSVPEVSRVPPECEFDLDSVSVPSSTSTPAVPTTVPEMVRYPAPRLTSVMPSPLTVPPIKSALDVTTRRVPGPPSVKGPVPRWSTPVPICEKSPFTA